MGREVRIVPPHWNHPVDENNPKYTNHRGEGRVRYKPLFGESFKEAAETWKSEFLEWKPEDHEGSEYWEYSGNPPDREHYVPYEPSECSWFQVYETVSEGTPVTPPFATKPELVEYLATKGTFWDEAPWSRASAEKFVEAGWFPSMMVTSGPGGNTITTANNM